MWRWLSSTYLCAYAKMGVHPRYVTALLLLSLLGASINIPVAQLPEEKTVENTFVRYAGVEYVVPAVRHWPGTIIAVNVGGAKHRFLEYGRPDERLLSRVRQVERPM